MNILVIYAHPYDGSFCKGILDTVVPAMEARGANVKVKDLVKMNFDATMRPEDLKATVTKTYTAEVQQEQKDVLWADAIVTICPIWFGSVPGFLKAYFDKVFITGFGYDYTGGLLQNKRVFSLFTFGSKDPYLTLANQYKGIEYLWDNIFSMVGFKDIAVKYFQGVPRATDQERAQYLVEAIEFVDQIYDKKLGEIGQIGAGELLVKLVIEGKLVMPTVQIEE
ncbi:NAD(P)H-dependent oxidoreductase [Flavobacterium aquicola]|uniref:NAD(P)H dehydrogenase (Quinone) n=1 Tax=Flavobacterium aquicola TaxID=1682742 RepID=A0A3E0EP54_9FLAO|nr:NAD(P)H-dependent oxidoreductase [Flavobacterium aquicola]REG99510.1 NAD(P)H dehydrogenase (quinone) [Flavobacterium aquicola]